MRKRTILLLAGTALSGVWIATCCSGFSRSDVTAEQIHLVNTQLNVLQENLAAIQSPRGWMLLLFGGSVLVPIVLAVVLLYRAEQAAIRRDEVLEQAVRHGLTGQIVHAALLPGKSEKPPRQLAADPPRLLPARRRRRRSGPKRREDEVP